MTVGTHSTFEHSFFLFTGQRSKSIILGVNPSLEADRLILGSSVLHAPHQLVVYTMRDDILRLTESGGAKSLYPEENLIKTKPLSLSMHVNPLKQRTVLVTNPDNESVTEKKESMSWKDAAKVSAVLTIGLLFTMFLPGRGAPANPEEWSVFMWEVLLFSGQAFFTNFIALAGLSKISDSK